MMNKMKYITAVFVLIFLVGFQGRAGAQPADTIYVSGIIKDAVTQRPINGARVQVGKFYSVLSGETGTYKLRIPAKNAIIDVSAVGYLTRSLPTQGVSQKDILLFNESFVAPKNNANAYTTTQSVTLEDELQTRFGSDIRVVKRSGQVGIGSNMFIRGYNSLNANAKPLIVVDGVIWDDLTDVKSVMSGYFINPLLDIDVNDIESVEVLKNATSIYGSKGANGVILIKTIRGRSQATKITFDAMTGVVQKPTLTPVMNAFQYRTYASDVLKGAGYSQSRLDGMSIFQDDETSLTYKKYHNDTKWEDQVYGDGSVSRYALSVQGGDEVAMYGFSMAYTGSKGVLNETTMDRLNTRFNSDINLGKTVKIATNIAFTEVSRDLRDDGNVGRAAPGFIAQIKSPLFLGYKYTTATQVVTDKLEDYDDLNVSNPLAILANGIGNHKQYRFSINAEPEWTISKSLKLSSNFGYSINKVKEHYFIPVTGIAPLQLYKQGDNTVFGVSYNQVQDQTMQQIAIFNDTKLKFDQTYEQKHHVNGLLGIRAFGNRFIGNYGSGHNTGGDYVTNLSKSLDYLEVDGINEQWDSKSVYAQANYDFNQRYFLWATASMDNSSRFGKETKDGFKIGTDTYALFPAVGAAWLVSAEPFMKYLSFIDRLNLRADLGETGNDNIGNSQRLAYLSPINYMDRAVGLQISNLKNEALQWETTQKMGVGVDLSLFNEIVNVTADIYKNNTRNLLTLKQNTVASGLDAYWVNEGSMQNTGYEVSLGLKLLNTKAVKWNFNVSASHNENRITALPDGDYTTTIGAGQVLTSVGSPAGLFYGYKSLGVFANDAEAKAAYNGVGLRKQNANASYSTFGAGDIHFDDKDGNGIIDANDMQVIGNPNPTLTGAIMNNFTSGNFTLDVIFTYSYGNDIYNYQRSLLESMSNLYNQSTGTLNRWKANGQVTDMPKASYGDPMGNSRFSSRWIEDGSYLKLQNVRLSYKLPIKTNVFDGLTIWTAVNNVVTFTKYLGSDPENSMSESILYQGIDFGLLPSSRVFNVGVKLNL
jgi:TonB-linked SusC/RagA family outer membrane protein